MSVQESENQPYLQEKDSSVFVNYEVHSQAESEELAEKQIPLLNYDSWSLEDLKAEVSRLLKENKVHLIKKHIDEIRYAFNRRYTEEVETKKDAFLQEGGLEIDFSYVNPIRSEFYQLIDQYKKHRDKYYKSLEEQLQANLARKQDIIDEIKSLVCSEEDIHTIYKMFTHLQQQWRQIGAVPRSLSEDLWKNYNHHVDNFYDFLNLNRELRDKDFKHNLEEKLKIIEKAEALEKETDIVKAFRELQLLHKVWKELGPVDKQYKEDIWNRFSSITKNIHDKKQEYQNQMLKEQQDNYDAKILILNNMSEVSRKDLTTHKQWQKAISEVENLRESFFELGRVSEKDSEKLWKKFREITREFNKKKNDFYRDQKKEQQENLEKKRALIEIAEKHKDSEDWENTVQLMKEIQEQWKQIGHVPYKYSDKIWKQFKDSCNHFFDRLHQRKKSFKEEEHKVVEEKKIFLEELKAFQLSGDKEQDLLKLQQITEKWEAFGRVPNGKRAVEVKFYKIIEALYRKLGFDKQETEMLKYNHKIEQLQDKNEIYQEINFVDRKISEISAEVLQLENNLQFFSNVDAKNPLLKDVIKKIEQKKQALQTWKAKLKELRTLRQSVESDS